MAQLYLPERTDEAKRPQRSPIPTITEASHDAEATTVTKQPNTLGVADVAVVIALVGIIALVIAAAGRSSQHTQSATISLNPAILPLYAAYSFLRMLLAYILALVFTLVYGHIAATNDRAARFMVPLLDILQSIPILSFLPGVVLTLVAFFPNSSIGVELAAIVLIFTSQAWNMTFSFYHSAKTIPVDLREAALVYRISPWRRFFKLEVSYGMIGLVWNSMMSWAGGWFFLMVAEQLTLGSNSYKLPGLGSYLQKAADEGSVSGLLLGLGTLIALIILLDLVFWRPLVAWSDKFKFETTRTGTAPESPILDLLRRSALLEQFNQRFGQPFSDRCGRLIDRLLPQQHVAVASITEAQPASVTGRIAGWAIIGTLGILTLFGVIQGMQLIAHISLGEWVRIIGFGGITLLRTIVAMAIALAWTVPLGVKIGMSPKWSRRLQPVVQVVASVPATALFPVLLIFILRAPVGGVDIAAILLMVLGTQWYVLFNVIAGAMAIPTDLREAANVYGVTGWRKWKVLILPAIFPYLVTGLITASGGAWNTSVVAEYISFNQQTYTTPGLGALIAQAAADKNLAILLASTLLMASIVVTINRLVWRRLYQLAERRYSMIG